MSPNNSPNSMLNVKYHIIGIKKVLTNTELKGKFKKEKSIKTDKINGTSEKQLPYP